MNLNHFRYLAHPQNNNRLIKNDGAKKKVITQTHLSLHRNTQANKTNRFKWAQQTCRPVQGYCKLKQGMERIQPLTHPLLCHKGYNEWLKTVDGRFSFSNMRKQKIQTTLKKGAAWWHKLCTAGLLPGVRACSQVKLPDRKLGTCH